jgi:hypothetical protein
MSSAVRSAALPVGTEPHHASVPSPGVLPRPTVRGFNNNRDDFAPRSSMLLRGLLDEAGVLATGGIEPPAAELRLF